MEAANGSEIATLKKWRLVSKRESLIKLPEIFNIPVKTKSEKVIEEQFCF